MLLIVHVHAEPPMSVRGVCGGAQARRERVRVGDRVVDGVEREQRHRDAPCLGEVAAAREREVPVVIVEVVEAKVRHHRRLHGGGGGARPGAGWSTHTPMEDGMQCLHGRA